MMWIFSLNFFSHWPDIELVEWQHFGPEIHLHELLWCGLKMLSLDKARQETGDYFELFVMQLVNKGFAAL